MSVISANFVEAVRTRVAQVVVGQETVVERLFIALFTGGHLLLQGMPGLAKTLLVNTMARAIDLKFARVQFTIDLLPSDILGSEVLDQRNNEFRTVKGPVFTNLLLADEINRAAPKVQSALLEAMQERRVTIGNNSWPLPAPFLVIALRRDERGAVPKTSFDLLNAPPVATVDDLVSAMSAVQEVYVSEVFIKHAVELVRRTRRHRLIEIGASPRAGIALTLAARARAFIHGRDYAVPEDLY